MSDPAFAAQRQQVRQRGFLASLVTLPFRFFGVLCGSLLLRCAFAGSDPNWGRALSAIGASGVPLDQRNQIIARLEDYSGVALARAFAFTEVETAIKWHVKYARQNGIHVSPSFMVNGLVTGLGSGDAVEDWAKTLG